MAELWHFNISWCVGLSGGWIISPQRVLLLSFKGEGDFAPFQRQLHHRPEQIPSKCGAPLQRGTLVKPEQRNNYFSRPPLFIRRGCSPSGRWPLSAPRAAAVCAENKEAAGKFQVSAEGTARPLSCETPFPVSLRHSWLTAGKSATAVGETNNILDCFQCVLGFFHL